MNFIPNPSRSAYAAMTIAGLLAMGVSSARGEAILQYFNQSHNEIAEKIPELAEAGYSAIWIPPPTKANGGLSVGYDLYDPFDIGSTDLRGQYSTRYGTEADLHNLIETAHRFGIRVYFDNVMNHRAYDVPGYNESTPVDIYPGMVAEDFHLRKTSDGFYRKWDNIDWGNYTEWDVMFRPLSDLIDISHETFYDAQNNGPYNGNFGTTMGDWHLKPFIVRHPNNPEFYDRMPNTNVDKSLWNPWDWTGNTNANIYTGFGKGNGISKEMLTNEYTKSFFEEDTGAYLMRAVRWLVDTSKVDGLRLDAVKHVPYYFFGATGEGKDSSNEGYLGSAQWQFNMTRGFKDWTNHRDTVFSIDSPRDDLMVFGEHLGAPPDQGPYFDAGMRLVDDDLRNQLNWRFSANQLAGGDAPGAWGFGPERGIMHAQSHDNDYADRKQLQHAFYFMRSGLGLVYTDGNNRAATLSGSGGAFPRWACTDFLGQWHESQIPTLLNVHENFAYYDDIGQGSSDNFIAWERGGNFPYNRILVMFNSFWDCWHDIRTAGTFPAISPDNDTYLYNYASTYPGYMTHSHSPDWPEAPYAYASQLVSGNIEMPPNSYALWGIKNPDPSRLWITEKKGLSPVITVYDDGKLAPWIGVDRVDGVDGDPDFNPHGVEDDNNSDYTYTMPIPVVKGTNVSFGIRADGSAFKLWSRLDGGMDFGNGKSHPAGRPGDLRDNPPGLASDLYLGFEDCDPYFVQRIWPEKFAAVDTTNCLIGTSGATSYEQIIGGAATNRPPKDHIRNDYGTAHGELSWIYHDPAAATDAQPVSTATTAAAKPALHAPTPMTTADNGNGAKTATVGTPYVDAAVAGWPTAAIPGFGAWDPDVYGNDAGTTGYAGYFVDDPSKAGITGFDANAYGLYANPTIHSGVTVRRPLNLSSGEALTNFSITIGLNWDSGIPNSKRGFEVYNSAGEPIFGIQMADSEVITYYGTNIEPGTWSSEYGSAAFQVALTRTDTGYSIHGTTRKGENFPGTSLVTHDEIAGYKVYMNGAIADDKRQIYFNNATYTTTSATHGENPTVPAASPQQFICGDSQITLYAKTPKTNGVKTYVYYTTDGESWPEGAGGSAANRATEVVEGTWSHTGSDGTSDWWKFDLPRLDDGVVLRYKIGAARVQGDNGNKWDPVQPDSADEVYKKTIMLSEWRIPRNSGLNLKTLAHYVHNDYSSWTTNGLDEGFHLFTARLFLNRTDGAEIPNTFRQTFYVDAKTPDGIIRWPASDGETIGGNSYGVVVQTDRSVQEVWYHIDDSSSANDGAGNGLNTNHVVEWAQATPTVGWTEEMATNTAMPKIWKFNYNGIAPNGQATIRVRLREWSSAKTNEWSASDPASDDTRALHVTELVRTVNTAGDDAYVYFSWPDTDGTMVQAGWKVWVKYTARIMSGLSDEDIYAASKVYINTAESGSTNRGEAVDVVWSDHQWDWGNDGEGENQMAFTMPNTYTGDDSFLHNMTVELVRDSYDVEASRLITHSGPLLPTCIITTPPETDSDGVKYIIEMEDVPSSVLLTNPTLRQTSIIVNTDYSVTNLDLSFTRPQGYVPEMQLVSCTTNGTALTWHYTWTVEKPGAYTFVATAIADLSVNTNLSAATNSAVRNATIIFRQISTPNKGDLDWDDDGIANTNENTAVPLPNVGDEQWTQMQVFESYATGKTDPVCPDSDGDGLPDGLELGWREFSIRHSARGDTFSSTDATADTNGDGWLNFLPDLDPPYYNTIDNHNAGIPHTTSANEGGNRSKLVAGSVTDPNNADTDYDGIPDGIEDINRNGWVDGDGQPLPSSYEYPGETGRAWPDGIPSGGEIWEETSPCVADSDGDGLSDGYGEDQNHNGQTDMTLLYADSTRTDIILTNAEWAAYRAGTSPSSRAINYTALFAAYATNGNHNGSAQSDTWPRLLITETDPLCTDTDGDSLPDGWETKYGLDPLDNGSYNFRTGEPGNVTNGPDGNPDGDTILDAMGNTIPYSNLLEFQGGTNPNVDDSIENPGGEGSIVIGQGAAIGSINNTPYHNEFLDWTLDDLIALDDYNQGGNSADIYRWGDGYDSSRDMVAFYFHDGGNASAGGDGKLYFRVDFDNLLAHAEESALNVYVAINFGSYGSGEFNLPDEVNAGSHMKWNALVGVYDSANGVLYRDMNPNKNTTAIGESFAGMGVETVENGFQGAYFNSELDSCAWSINRTDLMKAGWSGDPDKLLFQVYTVRDFTGDVDGSGDKGGLNDFTDTIGDDWLCSDYYNDYNHIAANSYYTYCVGRNTSLSPKVFNHLGAHANLALVAHGNQAIEPASTIQAYVNNGNGAGYHRPVQIHNIYTNCPLNLHITPSLAIGLEWANVGTTHTCFSGPALNEEIRTGIASGSFSLLGSTFSDHIPRYFSDAFNAANVSLATRLLNEIYGGSATNQIVSTNVFWPPERVVNAATLNWIRSLGYSATIIDQTPHLLTWFGREKALGSDAYKINRFWLVGPQQEMKAFVLSSAADDFRYVNTDSGLAEDLRHLFLRRARSGEAAISSLFYMWEELANSANADAYDLNLRWLANHPWIQVTTLDAALTNPTLSSSENLAYFDLPDTHALQAHDWVQHACNENYDNWYDGSGRHEGLAPLIFNVRTNTLLPSRMAYGSMTHGILSNVWTTVSAIENPDVKRLAEQVLFASAFETAFHQESNNNLTRWSYGDYIYPATDPASLQSFARRAQSRTRLANVYGEVDDWAGRTLSNVEVLARDVDLDGEKEYILRNNTLMALFESEGGIMTGAWFKDASNVYQVIGNFTAIPENDREDESAADIAYSTWADGTRHARVAAQRGSALKDVLVGTASQTTNLYTVSTDASSLTFTFGGLTKTISLDSAATNAFQIAYTAPNKALKVRCGLSPDLDALLRTGQRNMFEPPPTASSFRVMTARPATGRSISATIDITTGTLNTNATDQPSGAVETFNTVNMCNMAQTRQVELTNTASLAFSLAFSAGESINLPPVISLNPDQDPQIFPVGTTTTFTVEADDPDSGTCTLSSGPLPTAGTDSPSFATDTGLFSWHIAHLSPGNRTNDYTTNVTFTAADEMNTTSRTVRITIPWDFDRDGMADDWEYLKFGSLAPLPGGDHDHDGFSNYAEYIAGTSPINQHEYLGWTSLFTDPETRTATLTFQSIVGHSYIIQATDAPGLVTGPAAWTNVGSVTATGASTTWIDPDAVPPPDSRMYRIHALPLP